MGMHIIMCTINGYRVRAQLIALSTLFLLFSKLQVISQIIFSLSGKNSLVPVKGII